MFANILKTIEYLHSDKRWSVIILRFSKYFFIKNHQELSTPEMENKLETNLTKLDNSLFRN